jgi:hypothetical protein
MTNVRLVGAPPEEEMTMRINLSPSAMVKPSVEDATKMNRVSLRGCSMYSKEGRAAFATWCRGTFGVYVQWSERESLSRTQYVLVVQGSDFVTRAIAEIVGWSIIAPNDVDVFAATRIERPT